MTGDFVVIIEIWLNGKIQYVSIMINGYIPTQDDMETREAILDMIVKTYPNYEVLDITGIVKDGETLWKD